MHHGSDDEAMKAWRDQMAKDDDLKALADQIERLGATGKFPDGKLTPKDEGEIAFAVYEKDGNVILDFNKEVSWIGMSPEQATSVGRLLIKRAKKVRRGMAGT